MYTDYIYDRYGKAQDGKTVIIKSIYLPIKRTITEDHKLEFISLYILQKLI